MPFIPHGRRRRRRRTNGCQLKNEKTLDGLCNNSSSDELCNNSSSYKLCDYCRKMTLFDSVFMLALAMIFLLVILKGHH